MNDRDAPRSDPGGDPRRGAIDQKLLKWMQEPASSAADAPPDEARFASLALELFAFQFAHCPPYRRFCEGRARTPESVRDWRGIPAVPTGAFKEVALRTFPADAVTHVFRTSGTSTQIRGRLELDTLALYEASVVPSFHVHMLPQLQRGDRVRMRVLAPSAKELPDSSLSHMFETLLPIFGDAKSGFAMQDGRVDAADLIAAFREDIAEARPVVLCGTAFAFVHLLDDLARRDLRLALPVDSCILETGGFKGRSRELSRDALHSELAERLGVPTKRIVNQYGMTELASQFHDSVLRFPGTPRRKLGPPWARVRIVDPRTGTDAPHGEIGMVVVVDLANTGSVCAIQTADLGRRIDDGFEVLGRETGAEARGCSIAADEMLSRGSP